MPPDRAMLAAARNPLTQWRTELHPCARVCEGGATRRSRLCPFPSTSSIRRSTSCARATSRWALPTSAARAPSTRARSGSSSRTRTPDALYLRALEERQHHSLVLMKSKSAEAHHLGFKVGSEEDLDKAARFFKGKGLRHAFAERPYQGRTLQAVDPFGMPMRVLFRHGEARAAAAAVRPLPGCAPPAARPFQRACARRAGRDRLLRRARLPPHRIRRGGGTRGPHRRRLAAPQGQRARCRLHQRPRTPLAPLRLLGADGDEHHPSLRCDGHDGLSRQHGARARPARHRQRVLPLRARSRRPSRRVLHLRLPDHGPRPRAAALVACATRAGNRCGASRRRARGSRRAPRSPVTEQRDALFKANVLVAS